MVEVRKQWIAVGEDGEVIAGPDRLTQIHTQLHWVDSDKYEILAVPKPERSVVL